MAFTRRKTTVEHKVSGTYRKDRHGNRAEAPALEAIPDPPDKLSQEAAAHWYRKAGELYQIGQLHRIDLDGLARLCILYEVQDRITQGMNDSWGSELYLKHVKELERVAKLILPLERDFGMNPISRTRIKIDVKKTDEFEDF